MEESRWIKTESIRGGWLVRCGLCGKHFSRTFMGANTNYAKAERASREYAHAHLGSPGHVAALAALRDPDPPKVSKEEILLARIFESPVPDERTLRRRAAKNAALRASRPA